MTAEIVPLTLTKEAATRMVRELAVSSANIILIPHAIKRGKQRTINRIMVERCLRLGSLCEGPYIANGSGNWRMNFFRHAAGEEMTCVAEIDWPSKLLVVTVF